MPNREVGPELAGGLCRSALDTILAMGLPAERFFFFFSSRGVRMSEPDSSGGQCAGATPIPAKREEGGFHLQTTDPISRARSTERRWDVAVSTRIGWP